jgi:hypothetical protein
MDPTLVFLRAEVSLVTLKALFDAILDDEIVRCSMANRKRTFRLQASLDCQRESTLCCQIRSGGVFLGWLFKFVKTMVWSNVEVI